jgi:hypothetical protein
VNRISSYAPPGNVKNQCRTIEFSLMTQQYIGAANHNEAAKGR